MFTPIATPYAIEKHTLLANTNPTKLSYVLTKEELQKRTEFHKFLQEADEAVTNHSTNAFTTLLNNVLPIWTEEVNHNVTHDFVAWNTTHITWRNPNTYSDFVRVLNLFLTNAYGQDEETVYGWASRIDQYYSFDDFITAVTPNFWEATYDVNDLRFYAGKTRYYMPYVMNDLLKGYSPMVLRLINHAVATLCTPEIVNALLQKTTAVALRKLVSLDTHGRQAMTPEILEQLIDVGFTTDKEVREYAKKFGIGFIDDNFYTRVITAKKLYPVLAEYVQVI